LEYATAILFAQQVKHHAAGLGTSPMLEDINPLPGAEQGHAIGNRDRQVGLRQGSTHMRRHVIRTFQRVFVDRVAFRHQSRQESLQIAPHTRIVVFLDQQAGRGVADIKREQPLADAAGLHPVTHLQREGIQALAAGGNADFMKGLAHVRYSSESACYTRHMQFLVPHLFPSARLLEAAAQNLRLPALQTLLARGTRQSCPSDGVEAALCNALGIARQQDWPLAPITLAADGGEAGNAYWLRADPVHLRVMRDRIVLAGSDILSLTREEADALADALHQHFGDSLNPLPLHPHRWYLRFSEAPHLTTTPPSLALGCDIDPLQPRGEDAMRFRVMLNEAQMLLHEHPVNQAREARGELPVNSLWLWGGGRQPADCATPVPLYASNTEALALAGFCNAIRVQALPARLDAPMLASDGITLLDSLTHAGQAGDAYSWRNALSELEQAWFVPLLDMLRKTGPQGVRLLDPISGKALHLEARDAWKIWRRPRGLFSMLS